MKLKWGIPICLLMAMLILGFFARAEIQQHWVQEGEEIVGKTIFTESEVDIFFNEKTVIHSLPVSSYSQMEIAPDNDLWQEQTITPLVDYLKMNNARVLKITGYFLQEESGVQLGGYKNLGEARAGLLKQELIKSGIAAPRILISYSQNNSETLKEIFKFECYNDSSKVP